MPGTRSNSALAICIAARQGNLQEYKGDTSKENHHKVALLSSDKWMYT